MSRRRRSTMSEQLKYELAKDLGFYDTVQKEGWGGIRAKDAGNMVKRAIQLAEQAAAKQYEDARAAERADAVVSRYSQQQRPTPTYAAQTSNSMPAQAQQPVYSSNAAPAAGSGAAMQASAIPAYAGSTSTQGAASVGYTQPANPNPQQPRNYTQQSPYVARSQRTQESEGAEFVPFGAIPRHNSDQPAYRN